MYTVFNEIVIRWFYRPDVMILFNDIYMIYLIKESFESSCLMHVNTIVY